MNPVDIYEHNGANYTSVSQKDNYICKLYMYTIILYILRFIPGLRPSIAFIVGNLTPTILSFQAEAMVSDISK